MLQALQVDTVIARWDDLWKLLCMALPGEDLQKEGLIKQAAIEGRLLLWGLIVDDKLIGIAATTIYYQAIFGNGCLILYAAYAPDGLTNEVFLNCYQTLTAFGRSLGCTSLNFYTTNPKLLNWARRLSAKVEQYVTIPILSNEEVPA